MKFMFRIPNNVEVRKEGWPPLPGSVLTERGGRRPGWAAWWRSQNSSTFRCWLSPRQLPPARAGLLQGTKCNFIRMVVGSLSKSFRQALTGGALRPTVLVQKHLCHEGPTQDLAVPPHLSAMAPPCRTHPLPARSLLPISHSSPVAHRRIFLYPHSLFLSPSLLSGIYPTMFNIYLSVFKCLCVTCSILNTFFSFK